jgi:predicted NUDIX family NTP pyrophosphohydrolase
MKRSAGIVPFRVADRLEVLIAHPGGPFFAGRDEGAWSIIKGEIGPDESPFEAALREFTEETGWPAPRGPFHDLGEIKQKGGKVVLAWAAEADLDPDALIPGTFEMEWRGRTQTFREIDRVAWVGIEEAARLLNAAQAGLVARLENLFYDR